jgi:transposase
MARASTRFVPIKKMSTLARITQRRAQDQWREMDVHLAWCDERTAAHAKHNDAVQQASSVMGIGPAAASAVVATMGYFKQFRRADQFGARIGLVPRQYSSGCENNPGGPSELQRPLPLHAKRGDTYLRSLLIQGAKQAQRSDLLVGHGTARASGRAGKKRVALANKNARILWAVMTKVEAFDARHVSAKPGASTPTRATA